MISFDDEPKKIFTEMSMALERLRQLKVLAPICRFELSLGEVPSENYNAAKIARDLYNKIMDEQNEWEISQGY